MKLFLLFLLTIIINSIISYGITSYAFRALIDSQKNQLEILSKAGFKNLKESREKIDKLKSKLAFLSKDKFAWIVKTRKEIKEKIEDVREDLEKD